MHPVLVLTDHSAADLTNSITRINKYAANSGGYADVHRCRLAFDSTTVLVEQAVSHYQVPHGCVDVSVKQAIPVSFPTVSRSQSRSLDQWEGSRHPD
jgi:hypothetical protein